METLSARRPLRSRESWWAVHLARSLARARISPNAISLSSAVFAGIAGMALLASSRSEHRAMWLLLAATGVQLRLVCNLLDGMVAVEGGLKTKSGEVFNDLPDRVADPLILVSAGYAIPHLPWGEALGWCAALLAIFTAYVRMMGGAAGLRQNFTGPMAKQQRMAVMTAACVLSLFEGIGIPAGTLLWIALVLIDGGCVVTILRRTAAIVHELEER